MLLTHTQTGDSTFFCEMGFRHLLSVHESEGISINPFIVKLYSHHYLGGQATGASGLEVTSMGTYLGGILLSVYKAWDTGYL